MASDTVSTTNRDDSDLALSWSGRWTLAHRILAVNILTLVLLALAVLYLDSYRNRLSKERTRQTRVEAMTTAQALANLAPGDWMPLVASITRPPSADATKRPASSMHRSFTTPSIPFAGS